MENAVPLTWSDLRRIITQAGFPDVLYINYNLFGIAWSMAKVVCADSEGEFVWMLRTKVRPGKYLERTEPLVVDLSESNTIFDVEYY
jgi:hypothetical protein